MAEGEGRRPGRVAEVARVLQGWSGWGVVILPARDEQRLLPRALDSLAALEHAEQVGVLVHANNCQDQTVALVERRQGRLGRLPLALFSSQDAEANVGRVRAETARGALQAGCSWLLFLDADGSIPQPDFLLEAQRLTRADPEGLWSGSCDEFRETSLLLAGRAEPAGLALLDCASAFRGRFLPLFDPLFRYTDGSNTLVSAAGYLAVGGYEPKPVGGDSTLGDRWLAAGRQIGFFDRCVVPSCRKQWARGDLGGFVFYPEVVDSLPCVRGAGQPPEACSVEQGFSALARDLHAFLYFIAGKRRSSLASGGRGLSALGDRALRAFEAYAARYAAPVALEPAVGGLQLLHSRAGRHLIGLDWPSIEEFWRSGRLG